MCALLVVDLLNYSFIMMSQDCLSFNSFNTRGLGDGKKRRSIFKWLKHFHSGICLLQETHSTSSIESSWRKEWGGDIFFSHGTCKSKGVAILLPSKLNFVLNKQVKDDSGRFVLLDIDIENSNIILLNVYAPTKDKVQEQIILLQQLQDLLIDYQEKNLVIGGDFNTYLAPEIDKKGGRREEQSEYSKQLNTFLDEFNLLDVWRVVNPDEHTFTWRNFTRNGFVQSRIDYFFTSTHMVYDLADVNIKPGIKSDHSLIKITFKLTNTQSRGKGFWKFNSSLLLDPEYVVKIKQVIVENDKKYEDLKNKALLWDVIKCDIRSHTISYASWKAKQQKLLLSNLHSQLEILEQKLNDGLNVQKEFTTTKNKLEKLIGDKAQGSYIRSRSIHIESNEKSNKYFLQQEIKNANIKNIKCLKTEDGHTINDGNDILKEQKSFYQKLYSSGPKSQCGDECSFLHEDIPIIKEIDKNFCDQPITIEECGKSLKQLANNKAPGTDGFTADFYKFFWIDIKCFVYNSFIYSFENGILSIDQRRAILTLLPKIGKDLRWLKNWRPLSLLNTDYKILTKLLAIRLQTVLHYLIKEDQVAYIKNRYIGENIRKIVDIFDATHNTLNPGIAMFLDFEKAFDTVSWDFLFKTLKTFNFGPSFTKWVQILYNNPTSMVCNNGHASESFEIKRGIRQGCPLSALLFILVTEVMSTSIRNDQNIKGVNINGCVVKITQMADDTTIFVKDLVSVKNVLNKLAHFAKCSGLKLNKDKTEAIQLGIPFF